MVLAGSSFYAVFSHPAILSHKLFFVQNRRNRLSLIKSSISGAKINFENVHFSLDLIKAPG